MMMMMLLLLLLMMMMMMNTLVRHVCLVADIGEHVERTVHPRSVRRLHVVHVLRCQHHANSSPLVVTPPCLQPIRYTHLIGITKVSVL